MELRGDEKRIRALFCELWLDEQSRAPQFVKVWTRAEARRSAKVSSFNPAVAVIVTGLLITAVFSLAIWLRSKPAQSKSQESPQIASRELLSPVLPRAYESSKTVALISPTRSRPSRHRTFARQRLTERTLTHEAAMLSSWQSPTQIFMQTSAGFVLNSLPQLNQSVKELQLFLPKNVETSKESNQ